MPRPLEELLWEYALHQATSRGFDFSPDSQRYLRELISEGAKRMRSEGVERDDAKIRLAQENLRSFINTMADEAKRRGFPRLREETFYAAKSRLCPLWPFC